LQKAKQQNQKRNIETSFFKREYINSANMFDKSAIYRKNENEV
jgi:hypothetical protein